MTSSLACDSDKLLASLSAAAHDPETSVGISLLRTDLEEAYRRKVPPSLTMSDSANAADDWAPLVIEYATQLLTAGAWDLEIASMLISAWQHRHGIVGLHAGLRLLHDRWEVISPHEGMPCEACGQQLTWLIEELLPSLPAVVAAATTAAEGTDLCEELLTVCQQLPQTVAASCDSGAASLQVLTSTLQRCLPSCEAFLAGPPSTHAAVYEPGLATAAPVRLGVGHALASASSMAVVSEPFSREDALRRLQNLAGYFRRTEPLGPLANLLDVAVHWGRMSFAEWLPEVLRDPRRIGDASEVLAFLVAGTGKRSEEDA